MEFSVFQSSFPTSFLYKSIAGRFRPVRVTDGPITTRYRFITNARRTCFPFCCLILLAILHGNISVKMIDNRIDFKQNRFIFREVSLWTFFLVPLYNVCICDTDVFLYNVFTYILYSRPRWLNWMRHPTGDQEVAGSTPAEVGNILSWRLIMKYFLRSFSPFR